MDEHQISGSQYVPGRRQPRHESSAKPAAAKVLVIDDDPDIRSAASDVLEQAGYDVTCLSSGRIALSHLCQNPAPAVILVDVLMPGMNAWEFIAELKRREGLSRIPVIAMTGLPVHFGSPVGEERVLRKPITAERLITLVRTAAERPDEGGSF
jgi:CheY-like chemotaxis protein